MGMLKKLKANLRDISLFDRLCSLVEKSPCFIKDSYNEIYDRSLEEFLDSGVTVVDIDFSTMTLKSETLGKTLKLHVSSYPHAYGSKYLDFCSMYPSWKTIFKLRKIQLQHRDKVIEEVIKGWEV